MAKNLNLAALILKNLESECGAMEGYYSMITEYPDMEDVDKEKIFEIISDEAQHSLILGNMQLKYGGAVIASDGTAQVLNSILEKVSKN